MSNVKCNVSDCQFQRQDCCEAPLLDVRAKSGVTATNCAGTQCGSFQAREKRDERAKEQ